MGTKPLSGSMLTSWPRLTNVRTSRKRLRVYATPSSPSCIKMQEECQVVCQRECLTWEVWVEVCQEQEELVLAELGLPLRRSTRLFSNSRHIFLTLLGIIMNKCNFILNKNVY